ncbi:hypothetical protein WR25_08695 isoform K [Diploscapter pachys]|uniref:receptor protein serine/threonine kinase n=1 Tax=Diploscapter pachys TaxID=2018661 RepID=A0A2A2L1Y3_9BILA|nr:hypothetical protein WR25_08695 isoform B [Diploscapter pachys]PAV80187.1 hypothetical protein WR25_08695 isoform K [Diploscapter pachys]
MRSKPSDPLISSLVITPTFIWGISSIAHSTIMIAIPIILFVFFLTNANSILIEKDRQNEIFSIDIDQFDPITTKNTTSKSALQAYGNAIIEKIRRGYFVLFGERIGKQAVLCNCTEKCDKRLVKLLGTAFENITVSQTGYCWMQRTYHPEFETFEPILKFGVDQLLQDENRDKFEELPDVHRERGLKLASRIAFGGRTDLTAEWYERELDILRNLRNKYGELNIDRWEYTDGNSCAASFNSSTNLERVEFDTMLEGISRRAKKSKTFKYLMALREAHGDRLDISFYQSLAGNLNFDMTHVLRNSDGGSIVTIKPEDLSSYSGSSISQAAEVADEIINLLSDDTKMLCDEARKAEGNGVQKGHKTDIIGCGRYGTVFKAFYKGEIYAVKALTSEQLNAYFCEVGIYALALRHPSILSYLRSDIKRKKPFIAHRDLKASNVMVKSDLTCCIGDFGLAAYYQSWNDAFISLMSNKKGTLQYLAPELLTNSVPEDNIKPLLQADIYAFGLLIWELLARTKSTEFPEPRPKTEAIAFIEEAGGKIDIEAITDIVVTKNIRPKIESAWLKDSVRDFCPQNLFQISVRRNISSPDEVVLG